MAAILLFILAGIVLIVTFWNYFKNPASPHDNSKDENLKDTPDKQKTNVSYQQFIWKWLFQSKSERRRDYYRNDYLKSDAWQRKRYVVLKRDNWTCVYCGARATQVHHKRYAPKNIGKEPIEWLVSICKPCHDAKHR
jgi:hypothetical protein